MKKQNELNSILRYTCRGASHINEIEKMLNEKIWSLKYCQKVRKLDLRNLSADKKTKNSKVSLEKEFLETNYYSPLFDRIEYYKANKGHPNIKAIDLLLVESYMLKNLSTAQWASIYNELRNFKRKFHLELKSHNDSKLVQDFNILFKYFNTDWFREFLKGSYLNSKIPLIRLLPFFIEDTYESNNLTESLNIHEPGYALITKYYDDFLIEKISKSKLIKKAIIEDSFEIARSHEKIGFNLNKKNIDQFDHLIKKVENDFRVIQLSLFLNIDFDLNSLSNNRVDQTIRILENLYFKKLKHRWHLNNIDSYNLKFNKKKFNFSKGLFNKLSPAFNLSYILGALRNGDISKDEFVKYLFLINKKGLVITAPWQSLSLTIDYNRFAQLSKPLRRYFKYVDMKGVYSEEVASVIERRTRGLRRRLKRIDKNGPIDTCHLDSLRYINLSVKNLLKIPLKQYLKINCTKEFHNNVKTKLPKIYNDFILSNPEIMEFLRDR